MRKCKGQSFEVLLSKQLRNKELKFLFDERKFFLQIARLISTLRAKAGLSQAELAKRVNLSQPLIARLERGDSRRAPTFDTIYRVLKALGYSLELSVKARSKMAA